MTGGIKVKIKDLDKAIAKIGRYDEKKQKEIRNVVNKYALKIQGAAKKKVAVDTGRLRSSIAIELFEEGMGGRVGTNVKYGPYVEFGTGKFAEHPTIPGRKTPWLYTNRDGEMIWTQGQKARPYLRPAAEENKNPFKNEIRGVMKKT
jgi:HK97 gp10 family phage protein